MDRNLVAQELIRLAKHLIGGASKINSKKGYAFAKVNELDEKVEMEITLQETYQPGLFSGKPQDAIQKAMDAAEDAFLKEMRKHYEE